MKMNPSFGDQDDFTHRDGSVLWVILFSCLFHAIFLSLSFIFPTFPSRSPLKSYPVSLISLASQKVKQAMPSVKTAVPPASPVQNAAPPAIEKQKPAVTQIIEAPEPLPPLAQKTEVKELRIVEAIPSPLPSPSVDIKSAEAPQVAAPPTLPTPPVNAGQDDVNDRQVTASIHALSGPKGSINGQDGPLSNYPYYFQAIQNRISTQWSPPLFSRVSVDQGTIVSVVGFVVQPNGRIHTNSIEIEKSSGNRFYDESALRAIYNSNPLLPLPKEMTEDLRVHFEFRFMPD